MNSYSTFTERLDMGVRLLVPYGFMAVLLVLSILTVSIPFGYEVKAPFVLIAIYYWAIYRPTLIPSWLVFCAGGFLDLITGLPLGMNALVFVLTQWIIADQRRFLTGQPFVMVWIGFAFLMAIAGTLQWLIFGLLSQSWVGWKALGLTWLVAMLVFPLIYWLLHLTHKVLPVPAEPRSPYALKAKSRVVMK